ncbi:hypothetical protein [Nocardia brasiliensis]|nr:hypothetical protein [Nocardia brasiliensis]
MRAKTFGFVIAAVAVGVAVLSAPELLGFTVMLLGAIALWRSTRKSGVRR